MAHGLLPPTDFLTPTPVVMSAGTCFANDPRGLLEGPSRYIYAIFNLTNFWKYDTWTDSWQQLASPPGGAPAFGAGVTMCVDPSRNLVYLFMPDGANNAWFRSYDFTTDVWSAALNVITMGLVAPWGTSGALLHLCNRENATVTDDSIYLVGNNNATIYQYSIAAGTWTALAGGGGARGGAPGAGTTLNWIAARSIDFLYSVRGNATNVIDRYQISTDAWTTVLYQPPAAASSLETYSTGTCAAHDTVTPGIVILRDATMRLRELQFPSPPNALLPELNPVGTFPGTDGVAHVGQALVSVRSEDGTIWFYFAKHSQNTFMRLQRML